MSLLITFLALTLALTPSTAVAEEPTTLVYMCIPNGKPVYEFKVDSEGFRGPAHPRPFKISIENGIVTVKGHPWTGHIVGYEDIMSDDPAVGYPSPTSVVWDNPTEDPVIEASTNRGYEYAEMMPYIHRIP